MLPREIIRMEKTTGMKRLFYKRFSKKMLAGVEMIKLGVLDRLLERFRGIYGQETADHLAAAVVSELFCQKPTDPLARDFLSTNMHVVERELSNLKYDDDICKIITQAIRIKASLTDEYSNDMIKLMDDHIDKLTRLEIFIPTEFTPTPNLFLQIAHEFYRAK